MSSEDYDIKNLTSLDFEEACEIQTHSPLSLEFLLFMNIFHVHYEKYF